jgi:glycerol-3-phosphate dehydrogenase
VNGAEVVALRTTNGRVTGAEVQVDEELVGVEARAVVNAAGPWIDELRRLETPSAGTSVVLDKGAHALVPADGEWAAALTIPQDHVRVTFAVPIYGMLLLGTTETVHEGSPSAVAVEVGDVEQILAEASVALEPSLVAPDRVRASFAGLRVLPAGTAATVSARRETVITRGPGGMLSVAGGKLTTYRLIALGVLGRLRSELGVHRFETRPWALPGAAGAPVLPGGLEPEMRANLAHLYGSLATDVVAAAADDPALLEPLHPDGPDIAAQALYAGTHEWARSADDVVRRRTTLFYRGLADERAVGRVKELLGRSPTAVRAGSGRAARRRPPS